MALTSAGFTLADVMGMTLGQVKAYMAAFERREKERRLGDALAMRMAQADGEAWKAYVKKLEG